MAEKQQHNAFLGFLMMEETSDHGYMGALLVTTMQGVPQEFRCTRPVKPTALQRPLYGEVLESYVGVSLCGQPLLKSLQNKPAMVFVNKEYLLGIREYSTCPVAFVQHAGTALDVAPVSSPGGAAAKERFESTTGKYQPVVVKWHENFFDDRNITATVLSECYKFLDPVEPFERISKATDILRKQDKSFA